MNTDGSVPRRHSNDNLPNKDKSEIHSQKLNDSTTLRTFQLKKTPFSSFCKAFKEKPTSKQETSISSAEPPLMSQSDYRQRHKRRRSSSPKSESHERYHKLQMGEKLKALSGESESRTKSPEKTLLDSKPVETPRSASLRDARSSCSSIFSPSTPFRETMTNSKNTIGRVPILVTLDVYERMAQVGEGTYGKVYKAKNKITGDYVALKRVRIESEREGFPITGIREIRLLTSLRHENIVQLKEIISQSTTGSIYMVFEYMDHDLTGILTHPTLKLEPAHIKCLIKQMFQGLGYLHSKRIIHRDLKGSNLLLNSKGQLKLADFGLARYLHQGTGAALSCKMRHMDYTNRVITLWYRPPELLLGGTKYGYEIDLWSAGCIALELFTKKAIFPGSTEMEQLEFIFKLCGTPTVENWPEITELPWWGMMRPAQKRSRKIKESFGKQLSDQAYELIDQLLQLNPKSRPTCLHVLEHPYITTEEPRPCALYELPRIEGDWHEFESKIRKKQGRLSAAMVNPDESSHVSHADGERYPSVQGSTMDQPHSLMAIPPPPPPPRSQDDRIPERYSQQELPADTPTKPSDQTSKQVKEFDRGRLQNKSDARVLNRHDVRKYPSRSPSPHSKSSLSRRRKSQSRSRSRSRRRRYSSRSSSRGSDRRKRQKGASFRSKSTSRSRSRDRRSSHYFKNNRGRFGGNRSPYGRKRSRSRPGRYRSKSRSRDRSRNRYRSRSRDSSRGRRRSKSRDKSRKVYHGLSRDTSRSRYRSRSRDSSHGRRRSKSRDGRGRYRSKSRNRGSISQRQRSPSVSNRQTRGFIRTTDVRRDKRFSSHSPANADEVQGIDRRESFKSTTEFMEEEVIEEGGSVMPVIATAEDLSVSLDEQGVSAKVLDRSGAVVSIASGNYRNWS